MIRDNYLDVSKLTTSKEVMKLFDLVSRHGGVLRFVGGAIRDALKGIKGYDLNLATDLSPEEIADACADEGIKTIPLGIKQGSIGVVIDNTTIEVSSLYKYVEHKDGSISMEFTDNWEEDASRRDLTINAVYADEKGNVFDYYNGIEDLEKGHVRFIGSAPKKIKEDYVRILRYFRFYSLFGNEEPNQKAIEACRENCSGLKKVPMERIRDELFKIIRTPKAAKTYRLMQENNILSYIMPDADYIEDLDFFNEATSGFLINDENIVKMFILYRPDKALAENLAVRLKFSRREKQLFTSLAKEQISTKEILDSKEVLKIAYKHNTDFCCAKFLTLIAQDHNIPADFTTIYQNISSLSSPIFPLKGKDIFDHGIADSAKVGKFLQELEQIWIDSDFDLTKEQLLVQLDNIKTFI